MAAKPQAVESDSSKTARKWIAALDASERWQREWVARSRKIIRRYKDERSSRDLNDKRRFAILWSNIQTLGPAVYAQKPEPVVTRRFKDADPVGRYASEALERALSFSVDQYDFDDRIKLARDDYLLIARGQIWVRYVPYTQGQGEQITQQAEDGDVKYAEVCCDHLNFADWGMQPCRSWDETEYVWRRAYLTRDELIQRFGKVGKKVPLDWKPEDEAEHEENHKKSAVYEIWDKVTRKVYWISKSYPDVLDEKDDFLGLREFFPCPRPLMGTLGQDNYIPVPDYVFYQDQAEELDDLTAQIGKLTDALRLVGVYAGEEQVVLANMFNGEGNTLIPVESMASLQDKGGLSRIIEWMPIDMVIQTLNGCYEARARILEDIYQITGISDIVRGASDPQETATAQGIKAQWGSLRVRDRQKELARFARDILRLKAEIIAKHFPVETLEAMTDLKLLTQEQKQQFQIVAQLAQQNPALAQQSPLPPNAQEMMSEPTWEEVVALLRNDTLRAFRIDVETDSTIEPDEQAEKQAAVELTTAVGQFLGTFGPIVQQAPPLAAFAADLLKFVFRRFHAGRELEDSLERAMSQLAQMPPQQEQQQQPDPAEQEAKMLGAQATMMKAQAETQRTQADIQYDQADLMLRARQQEMDAFALQRDPQPQAVS